MGPENRVEGDLKELERESWATVRYAVWGTTPLLCRGTRGLKVHNDGLQKARANRIPTPEQDAETGVYPGPRKTFLMPVAAFQSAIVSAAKISKFKFKPTGKGIAVLVYRSLGANTTYDPDKEFVPIWIPKNGGPDKWVLAKKYTIDTRRVVIQTNSVMRSRARFKEWGAIFELRYNDELIPVEFLDKFLADAGQVVGVGDFRPYVEKSANVIGGPFGRFKAARMPM